MDSRVIAITSELNAARLQDKKHLEDMIKNNEFENSGHLERAKRSVLNLSNPWTAAQGKIIAKRAKEIQLKYKDHKRASPQNSS